MVHERVINKLKSVTLFVFAVATIFFLYNLLAMNASYGYNSQQISEKAQLNKLNHEQYLLSEEIKNSTSMVVTASSLNLRSEPGIHGGILASMPNGSEVETTSEVIGNWIGISYEGIKGFASLTYLYEHEQEDVIEMEVTASALNIRSMPSIQGDILETMPNGTVIETNYVDNSNWVAVSYNGVKGYSSLTYLMEREAIENEPESDESATNGTDEDSSTTPPEQSSSLEGISIVVDPGHGGEDPGATSGEFIESELALSASDVLQAELEARGATVIMTRTSDVFLELEERAAYAEEHDGEIFVSIHLNQTGTGEANGTETFYNSSQNPFPEESQQLAQSIQDELAALPTDNRGIKEEVFTVLTSNSVPSVLIELAFLDSPVDQEFILDDSFFEDAAALIANGVENYFGVND
ncbi:N-acetylmuramoyl-L-alanine amidase [Bacillus sp. FJAT-45350]|uniref:N-acetylmuramoyl-L-alanine amidase n=1 Tax=Bacillus sp. FJAT-45350 TaxID=2011014 RepID=UPI000BB7157A|nr:N-acetylmuramoyl-L-alanine amidase [Bacillus sp. FJAT-45350]